MKIKALAKKLPVVWF